MVIKDAPQYQRNTISQAFGPQWTPAIVPTQILVIAGASTLVIDAVGATLMASGRARATLWYGLGHFLAYGAAVFLVTPLGLAAVAAAANQYRLPY